jgi:hypothetical protein
MSDGLEPAMTNAARCLEALQIEGLVADSGGAPFEATDHPSGPDGRFDILARKGNRTIASEIKAGSNLGTLAGSPRTLSRRARGCSYEFCLDAADAPLEVKVRVQDPATESLGDLKENRPAGLAALPAAVVEGVARRIFGRVEITAGGMCFAGVCVVAAQVPRPI